MTFGGAVRSATLNTMIAAVPWHYWIGFVLFLQIVGVIVLIGVGYLHKVTRLKYSKNRYDT